MFSILNMGNVKLYEKVTAMKCLIVAVEALTKYAYNITWNFLLKYQISIYSLINSLRQWHK